jgi:hypothetical protein
MGAKTFRNATQYDLSIMLTVRRGDQPGNEEGTKSFSLSKGQRQFVEYSSGANPYLDGIAVNAVEYGNIVASQEFVITRGSQVDNEFNTNKCIDISMNETNITLSFHNS